MRRDGLCATSSSSARWLALGACPTVAAHGRNDKRIGTGGTQLLYQRSHNLGKPRQATTADSNGNALAWLDAIAHARPLQLRLYTGPNVFDWPWTRHGVP